MAAAPVNSWVERDGTLLRLRLDQPKANLVDARMIAALQSELDAHDAMPGLRGVLIDASGPHFSFGASVEEHLPEQCAKMLASLHRLVRAIYSYPVPVMAVIRGQCLGGGLELVSGAFRLFAAPDARLGQPELQLGVFAPAASCLLHERLGPAAARHLLYSGASVDADEALRIGLVDQVDENPEQAALDYYDRHLAPKSAAALRHAVSAAHLGATGEPLSNRLERVERLYLDKLMSTRDAVEGLTAFIEKRPAKWEDR